MPFAEKSPIMCLDERGVCNAAGKTFSKGLKDGIPICLGYLSVSFTFGMMAAKGGLPLWAIQLISMTNLTSAGQFAGTALILSGGAYLEIAVTTFVINLRYTLMGVSLSQKLEPSMPGWKRALLTFGNTDEIFAVAMQQKGLVSGRYLLGLIMLPYIGWASGTLLGPPLWRVAGQRCQRAEYRNLRDVCCHSGSADAKAAPGIVYRMRICRDQLHFSVCAGAVRFLLRLGNHFLRGSGICLGGGALSGGRGGCLMELDVSRVVLSVVIMAGVTYLLRMLPVTIFRKKIENRFVRSFLAYVPYAVLAAMTIPDIFFATASLVSAALGLAAAILLSYKGKSLLTVALGAVAVVFLAQRLLPA